MTNQINTIDDKIWSKNEFKYQIKSLVSSTATIIFGVSAVYHSLRYLENETFKSGTDLSAFIISGFLSLYFNTVHDYIKLNKKLLELEDKIEANLK